MPGLNYPQPYNSNDNGLPQEQQSSREWVLEWNRKSDTSEVEQYLQQIQRSHSSSAPETNSDSPSGSFARSSSLPRTAGLDEEQMESEPFQIQNLSYSSNEKFMELRQTSGEVTSDEGIEDSGRGREEVYVSLSSLWFSKMTKLCELSLCSCSISFSRISLRALGF